MDWRATSSQEGAPVVSNADIADKLLQYANVLGVKRENFYKAKAYRRAAIKIRNLSQSLDEMVRDGVDLTQFAGVGTAIASAIREIVLTGTLARFESVRSQVSPELYELSSVPGLAPQRVRRAFKKLQISSISELQERLGGSETRALLGPRLTEYLERGMSKAESILLYRADEIHPALGEFLLTKAGAKRVQLVGACRRRVEVVDEIAFVIDTDDFSRIKAAMERYGGRAELVTEAEREATFMLPAGIPARLIQSPSRRWGAALIRHTGSAAHVEKLDASRTGGQGFSMLEQAADLPLPDEAAVYDRLGLAYIEPELREGHDEVERAANRTLPLLVTQQDLQGELHAHSLSSDGVHSIEQMAAAARERGYEYLGITDHSQSLKIAKGVSVDDLWKQIRYIDSLNALLTEIRVLKSAEVDILADGSLDYPDDLLQELDYTVCSIHSRFGLGKIQQTERVMRAMDNRYFNILGHATGRLLLKRSGYEVDMDRLVDHARQRGCFFEINSSPDRLDLSAENARKAASCGVKIAISTDAHSTRELDLIRYGLDQARRAGLEPSDVLNCLPWNEFRKVCRP